MQRMKMKKMATKQVKNITDDVMCFRAGSGVVVEHECHIDKPYLP